ADTLGLGVMQNFYGDAHRLGTTNSSSTETLIELYYQYEATPYTSVVPVLQWVIDPGGTHRQADAILGIHVNVHL
ncbi:MAG TPA: carbohydrate porin, partial [Humisphaera sp.]